MNKTKWIIFTLVVVAIFGGIIWANKSNDTAKFKGDPAKIITDGPIPDQVLGTRDQKVVLIEYGDFQCPACGSMYQPVKTITEKYKDQLTFIFRNYPLSNIHPNAMSAAAAAEAAGLQNKYWLMHDKLYETQTAWSNVPVEKITDVFAGIAGELGLNVDQFKKDMVSSNVNDKIARDRSTGQGFKIQSTPSFVLNGTLIPNNEATNQNALMQKVENAIKSAYPQTNPPAPSQNQ